MLTPELMLSGYAQGIFPMAEGRHSDDLHWVDPRQRGVLPLDGFHISRSLARAIRRGDYSVRVDTAFGKVVRHCAAREETWINDPLIALYEALHASGHAHSLEVLAGWRPRGRGFRRDARRGVLWREHVFPTFERLEDRACLSCGPVAGRRLCAI